MSQPDKQRKDRILVIDDDEIILTLLEDVLSEEYEVVTFSRGEQAVESVRDITDEEAPYTIAFIDLNMPGIDGLETARKIRTLDPRLAIVLMTGGVDFVISGLDPLLKNDLILFRKPFSVEEVIQLARYFSRSWHRDRELETQQEALGRESVRREELLRRNRAIVETALDCIITIDHEGRVIEWNPAAEQTFGYSRQEILGQSMSETIVPHQLKEAHEKGMNRYLDTRESKILRQRIEITARHKDGHEFPVELAIAPILLGEQPIFTAYLRDISVQRTAEAQMRLQSKTLEAAANGIIIVDTKGKIVWCNSAFLELTGYESIEVIGRSPAMLKSGLHDDEFYRDLWQTVQSSQVWHGEIQNRRKNGEIYTEEMTITPVTSSEGEITHYIAIKQDITERKQIDEQLVRNEAHQRIISYFATSLLGSNTEEEILWDIATNCISRMNLEDAAVYVLDEKRQVLVQRAADGLNKEQDSQVLHAREIPIGKGIIGHVALTGESECVADLSRDPRYIVDEKPRRSELAVPILYENQVIGVIDSEHSQADFFQDHHRQILETIASLAAHKIMRARSIRRTEESEVKYRSIFESIQDVYAEIGLESGLILEISPSIEQVGGYTREEMIGQPIRQFYAPPGVPPELMNELRKNGRVDDYEVTLIDKQGRFRHTSFTATLKEKEGETRIIGSMRDVTERVEIDRQLKRRLGFEQVVSSISSTFIHAGPEDVDAAINDALRQICEFNGVDRSYVFMFSENGTIMSNTHEWCAPSVTPEIDNLQNLPSNIFPWWMQHLRQLKAVAIPNVAELPPEASSEREILEQQDIQSLLVLPIHSQGKLMGFVGFDVVNRLKEWETLEISLLQFIAEIMANALIRRRDFRAIRESRERLDMALNGANLGLWDWDVTSGETLFDETWLSMLGYQIGDLDLNFSTWETLIHPDDRARVAEKLQDHLEQGSKTYQVDHRLRTKEGDWKWIATHGQVVERDSDGKALRMLGIHIDIDKRVRQEEALRHSEQRLSTILNAIPEGMLISDPRSRKVQQVNPAGVALLGGDEATIVGRDTCEFFPDLQDIDAARISEYDLEPQDTVLVRPDGHEIPVLRARVPIELLDGTYFLISFINNAAQKQAEQALQNNIAMKTNFVSNVSHELRTPMASILGFAGTILRDKGMDDETKMDFIRIIHEEGQRLTRLIENVLDISRMEAGTTHYQLAPMMMETVLEEALQTQRVMAGKKDINLEVDVMEDLPLVKASPDAIRQLAVNLISNAIKFTDPGGTVAVSTFAEGDEIVLKVRDTGIGIPAEHLPHIFDKFYRVAHAGREDEGTGIGLAIVKDIADQHGARVSVESEFGAGTTFFFRIPILKD